MKQRNPRNILSLNGSWQLQPSNDGAMPSAWNSAVPVPALVNSAEPLHYWKTFKYHWHRTTFEVANESDLSFIVIEQAMFGTDVWLNGKHLGGDIACYTSQEYDAGSALKTGVNELIVRVGQRENLPSESAVGKDQERTEWIPGIWGDVYLLQCGNPRIKLVQVIPHIETATAEVRVTVQNCSSKSSSILLSTSIRERKPGKHVSKAQDQTITVEPNSSEIVVSKHEIAEMHLWSPESPFLYELESQIANLSEDESQTDKPKPEPRTPNSRVDFCATTFGMREFKVVGSDFYFNGKRIFLRGGNIAFHRFLSDADRRTLPWNLDWVKKLLIDIPKEHNFNFFRSHIGQLYNRWYDIADEHGMLLQNEWMFWTATGTREQITKEFTLWLQDNWNHPSIIIWDALNESSDDVVQKTIVPEIKKLDPTRPWESVDFVEEHPYIYSLGPVLNDKKFGFTRSLDQIQHSSKPTMLNEFCWWWLDKEFNPSLLTKDVVSRWLGPNWTKEQLIAHQSFLVTELVELFRRMRVDAIQPFVYLSNNSGPTANWFVGDIKELKAKPILTALKNAFAPFGISCELWDRHFIPNESRTVRHFVLNDEPVLKQGVVRSGIVNGKGKWVFEAKQPVEVQASGSLVVPVEVVMPSWSGDFTLRAELYEQSVCVAVSEKPVHVIEQPEILPRLHHTLFALLDKNGEVREFFEKSRLNSVSLSDVNIRECDALIVSEGEIRTTSYQARLGAIAKFLEAGKTVVVLEPENGIEEREELSVALGVDLTIERREDADKGGYDSYVFADDLTHPLWSGIPQEHLKMFNGGYGGEVVSQHNVTPTVPHTILARCGMHLGVIAVCEIPVGKGRVIVSRLQLRGRLVGSSSGENRFARRMDPVLQRYFVNLLGYSVGLIHD